MYPNNTFELSSIGVSIRKNKRTLLVFTVCGAALGLIFSFTAPPKYKPKADLIVRNPLYDDRGNLYSTDGRPMDYFAGEDDLDKIILLSKSDAVIQPVIRNMNLARAYNIDTSAKAGLRKLENRVKAQFNIIRNEYRALTVSYTDTEPDRAADVTNEFVKALENALGGFYRDLRVGAHRTILAKIVEEDSAINALTDTLALLRHEYEIYDLISPSRHNIILSAVKSNGKPGFEKALEKIQNIESVKDELVSHRANQVTLADKYAAAIDNSRMPLIKVITPAKNNIAPMLSSPIIVVICMLTSLLCGILVILIKDGISVGTTEKHNN